MRRQTLVLLFASVLLALVVLAPGAMADPTRHFTESFVIICGGNSFTIVAKPGSSNVISVNGQPSNAVSILFGFHVVDNLGNTVIDFQKPGNQPTQTCTDTSWPPGWTATATTIITPAR